MSFKKLVKIKIKEYALDKFNESKFKHSKMDDLIYTELKIQDYLISEEISVEEKRNIFHFRTRMASFSDNYKEGQSVGNPCSICRLHIDSQKHAVNCVETMKNVKKNGNYNEIFTNNISSDTAAMLLQIMEFREDNKLG